MKKIIAILAAFVLLSAQQTPQNVEIKKETGSPSARFFVFPSQISSEQFLKCAKWLAPAKQNGQSTGPISSKAPLWNPVFVITDFEKLNMDQALSNVFSGEGPDVEIEFNLIDIDFVAQLKKWNVKKLPAFIYVHNKKAHIMAGCAKDPEKELVKCLK